MNEHYDPRQDFCNLCHGYIDQHSECDCPDDADVVDDSYNDDDGLTDAQADAMTLASAYGGDWWDM